MRRLQKDLKEIRDSESPLVGVTAAPLDDSIFKWHANIRGPVDTVYAGGVFHIQKAALQRDGKAYHSRHGEYFHLFAPETAIALPEILLKEPCLSKP